MTNSSNIIGYARVSTQDQAFSVALKQQVGRLKAAGASRVFADIASRTKDDREALAEILKLAEGGEVSVVLVTRLDRVTSSPGLFEQMSRIFQAKGVELRALDERVDVHSVDGEFAAGLQIYFSRREVRTISLRIKKANEYRRSKGKANSVAPWGYRVESGHYKFDSTPFLCLLSDRPEEGHHPGRTKVELALDIIELFFKFGSLSQTAKQLHSKYGILKFSQQIAESSKFLVFEDDDDIEDKSPATRRTRHPFCWSPDGLRVWICSPVLRGHTPYHTMETTLTKDGKKTRKRLPQDKWEIRYNSHPEDRLLSDEQWGRIQEMLARNKQLGGFGSTDKRNLLTGLLFCGHCGRRMKSQGARDKGKKRITYYQCKSYMQERACTSKRMILESACEEAIAMALTERAEAIAALALEPEETTEPAELLALKSQLEGLKRLGTNPALEEAKSQIQSQIDNFRSSLEIERTLEGASRELLLWAFSDPKCWQNLSREDKEKLFPSLVQRVEVKDGVVSGVELKV